MERGRGGGGGTEIWFGSSKPIPIKGHFSNVLRIFFFQKGTMSKYFSENLKIDTDAACQPK